jgi:hypothetical protein
MSTGNAYGPKSSSFGGGIPVWRSIDPNGKWQAGGVIQNLPAAGTVIATGHPVEIDTAAHTAKLANFFAVHTDPTTGTTLKVKVFPGQPRLKVGNFIGVPPAISGGEMETITVGAITSVVTDGVGYDQITIVGSSLGTSLAVDSLLTEGVAEGTTVPYAVPNALTANDVYVESDTTVATVAGVHTGTVYAERTPYMSDGVKTALTTIKFDNAH